MKPFYNTTNEVKEQKEEFQEKAVKQDIKVLALFRKNPNRGFTPLEVHRTIFDENTPETSTRRSITNLQKSGYLIKTGEKVVEKFGRPNFRWRFRGSDKDFVQANLF
jgi:hypothetical protein